MAEASYWHTPLVKPLQWLTMGDLLDKWAQQLSHQEAYVVHSINKARESVTFSNLRDQVQNVAEGLLQLGLKPGDNVLITGITAINWLVADFACILVGIRTVRCQLSNLTKDGLTKIATRNNCKALIYHPGLGQEFEKHLMKCIPEAFAESCQAVTNPSIPCLQYVISMLNHSTVVLNIENLKNRKHANFELLLTAKSAVEADDILTVFMTSGSTGFPKAIPRTHFSFINCYLQSPGLKYATPGDRYFCDRSLSWLGSLPYLPMIHGLTMVYVQPLEAGLQEDLNFSLKVIAEEKITCGLFLQYLLLDMMDKYDLGEVKTHTFRWAVIGGESIQESLVTRSKKYIKHFIEGYGGTEMFAVANRHHSDSPSSTFTGYQVGCGYEVKITGECGSVVPIGTVGEICIRSLFTFTGYMQQEESGMRRTRDGWVHTGDGGIMYPDGTIKVLGRQSDVISRGTILIYPSTVAEIIAKFPHVEKVAVIGVPDRRLGENICACIIPQSGKSLTEHTLRVCFDEVYTTEGGLGLTPAYFMFLDHFPKVNGKVDKKSLKKMAIQHFKLDNI